MLNFQCKYIFLQRSHNIKASGKGFFLLFLGFTLPIAILLNFAVSSISDKLIIDLIGTEGFQYLNIYLVILIFTSVVLKLLINFK